MEQQRVRISDIAEELGLSTATVSNVIHGKTAKISDQTVRKVQALLEERQYIPSMAGILLAQNASRIIGVFLNDHEKYEGHTLEDAFIASSLNYLSEEIEKAGQFMMVKKAKKAEEILRFASMWNMDGLVVIGFCEQDYRYLRDHMRIPFVVYDGFCQNPERIVNIMLDNFDGGMQAGAYFRKCGHQSALCISDNETGVDQERIEGFRNAFGVERTSVLLVPMHKQERLACYEKNWRELCQTSAIFAVSDFYAIEVMQFLTEHGRNVPLDCSVIGFDDIPMTELVTPKLSTIRQDGARRAELALEMLRELRSGNDVATSIRLPVELVLRASTKGED